MELKRDALLQVIKAERSARMLSNFIQLMICEPGKQMNMADFIQNNLADALLNISGETNCDMDFSKTQILLRSEMDDETVADMIERLANDNELKQPKPNLTNKVQFNEMLEKFGGYKAETPEGEWS